MAESQEAVVVVPVILEVAEIEVEVTIGVRIHVRHPVVAIGVTAQAMYNVPSIITGHSACHILYFIPSL